MSFTAEQILRAELQLRHEKCRQLLKQLKPQAQGLLVFSRTNIYYLSGTRANGMLWLPLEGEPVLLVRKGEDRCRLESCLNNVASFKSYSNIPEICADFGSALGNCIAAEMQALPWSLAQMLKERLNKIAFVEGDKILHLARFIKTDYELDLLHKAYNFHHEALKCSLENTAEKHKVLLEQFPKYICVGMTEREIAHTIWRNFFAHGHAGMLRVSGFGQEVFLGKIATGKNALYPSPFYGAMGLVGEHPCIPFMGNAGSVWQEGQILSIDTGFIYDGYHSASSITCFAGRADSIPQIVRQAHDCCFEILTKIKKIAGNTLDIKHYWNEARTIARKYGFDDEFMGLNTNKSLILAQSIGLSLNEGAVIASSRVEQFDLAAGAVFSVCPLIAIPFMGVVSIEHSFELNKDGQIMAFANLEQKQEIVCIDD